MDDDGYINNNQYLFSDGFESQSGWNGEQTTLDKYNSSPNQVHSGNYSGQINCPESLGQAKVVHSSEWVPVNNTQDTEYTYSAWVYSNGPSAGIKLFMKDGNGYITQTLDDVSTDENVKWVHLTGTVNVSSSITSLNIQLINYGQQPGIDDWYTVWFDDVSIKKTNTTSEIVQEDNYYPFGLKHKGYNITVNGGNDKAQKSKYNGKELQDEMSLGWYDYQARNYDPALGRWFSVDPLAEQMRRFSPYTYAYNNPVVWTDPDGMAPETEIFNIDGKKIGEDSNGDDGTVSIVTDKKIAKEIEKNYKNGGVASDADVLSGAAITTKTILKEALHVLKRGDDNGGLREESSIVGNSGDIYRGETGPMPTIDPNNNVATAPATLPDFPKGTNGRMMNDGTIGESGGVSIHLHPAGLLTGPDGVYPFNAEVPTPGVDNNTWKKNGFTQNIIVGRLGAGTSSNITKNPDGSYNDSRDIGAAIYMGSNSTTPAVSITKKAIENIIK